MADTIQKTVITKLEVDDKQAKQALSDYTKAAGDAEKATEKNKEATEDYSGALEGMVGHLGILPGSLQKGLRGVTSLTGGFKGLRAAIIATGIGAFILALTALFTWFQRTDEGQEKLAVGLAALGQIIDTLLDFVADLGKALYDAFTDPQQAVSDLWEAIKTNFLNRVKAIPLIMGSIGKAIESAFKLDWEGLKENLEEVAEGFVQISTGLDSEQQKAFIDGVKRGLDEINEKTQKAIQLQELRNQLGRARIGFMTREAELESEIAAARLIANDETKELSEQIEGINTASEKTAELYEARKGLLQTEISILAQQQALGHNTIQDNEQIARLKADLIRLDKQEDDALRSLLRRTTTLHNAELKRVDDARQAREEADEAEEERISNALFALEDLELKQREHQAKRIDDANEMSFKLIEIEEERLALLLEREDLNFEERAAAELEFQHKKTNLLQNAFDTNNEIAKKQAEAEVNITEFALDTIKGLKADDSAFGKVLAVGQVLISMVEGSMKTVANLGLPLALPFLGLVNGMGLKAIADIKNVQEFGLGGFLNFPGRSHKVGGVMVNAEHGEAMINARSMADPFLRSIASRINEIGGGVRFAKNGGMFGQGGQGSLSLLGIEDEFLRALRQAPPVLVKEDLDSVNNRVSVRDTISTF